MNTDPASLMKAALAQTDDLVRALELVRDIRAHLEATGQPGEPALPAVPAPSLPPPGRAPSPWNAPNGRRRWQLNERLWAAEQLDRGVPIDHVAASLGRTVGAVEAGVGAGHIPCAVWNPRKPAEPQPGLDGGAPVPPPAHLNGTKK